MDFKAGAILTPDFQDWSGESLQKWVDEYQAERGKCDELLQQSIEDSDGVLSERASLIIADVRAGGPLAGFAPVGAGPAFVQLVDRHWGGRTKHDKYANTVAHELGHSIYGLRHSFRGDCEGTREELKSLMSWPKCDAILGLGSDAYISCSQRESLGWVEQGACDGSSQVPSAPTLTRVTPADGSVTLEWNAPTDAAPITDYDVNYRRAGAPRWTEWRPQDVSTQRSATITGLTNGVRYEFVVWAHNDRVGGPHSKPVYATPMAPKVTNPDDLEDKGTDREAPPVVRLSIGRSAQGVVDPDGDRCSSVHCRWLRVETEGLAPGPHTLVCAHKGAGGYRAGWFETNTVSSWPDEDSCFFGFPGSEVFVIVGAEWRDGLWHGGHYSNTIRWPNCNAEPSQCAADSGPTGPQPSVTLSVGRDARDPGRCSSVHCRWLRIDASGLGSGPHSVECWHEAFRSGASNFPRAAFASGRRDRLPTEDVCFFGFPGVKVWAVVNGVKSNEIRWP